MLYCLRVVLPADDELEELIACTARLDKQKAPADPAPGSGSTGSTGGDPAVEPDGAGQPATVGTLAGPCPWLFNVTQSRGAPLYYSLHRALHSRR